MYDFMAWLEASALGRVMRESGPWTYAVVNLSHILGVATLFGSILVLDLRLLGLWRRIPLDMLAEAAAPVAAIGFGLAVMSGVGLFATQATEYVDNPFLYIKFVAIAIGFVNALLLMRSAAWQRRGTHGFSRTEDRQLAWTGGTSLACWLTAIGAGRLIGYW